jgi:hypothetical protein
MLFLVVEVRVVQPLVFCVMFCLSFYPFFHFAIVLSVLPFAIVLSVLPFAIVLSVLPFAIVLSVLHFAIALSVLLFAIVLSDYPFGIIKPFPELIQNKTKS